MLTGRIRNACFTTYYDNIMHVDIGRWYILCTIRVYLLQYVNICINAMCACVHTSTSYTVVYYGVEF